MNFAKCSIVCECAACATISCPTDDGGRTTDDGWVLQINVNRYSVGCWICGCGRHIQVSVCFSRSTARRLPQIWFDRYFRLTPKIYWKQFWNWNTEIHTQRDVGPHLIETIFLYIHLILFNMFGITWWRNRNRVCISLYSEKSIIYSYTNSKCFIRYMFTYTRGGWTAYGWVIQKCVQPFEFGNKPRWAITSQLMDYFDSRIDRQLFKFKSYWSVCFCILMALTRTL